METFDKIVKTCKNEVSIEKQDEIILQPYNYISQIPGKQIRSKIGHAFNFWLKISSEKLAIISEIIQMLHQSSLMIDDIEDNSVIRRGIPTTHKIYGVASTINSANFVYFLALEKAEKLGHPDATKIFTQQLLELHRGQGVEIYWCEKFQCPEFSDYILMAIQKTGGLFKMAIELTQLFSENEKDFSHLIDLLGLYFQIRDDYCNITSKNYSDSKGFYEDLTEGKFSFPIIHAIKSQPKDERILNILKQRTRDIEVKKKCIDLLEEFGSLRYTRQILEELDKKIRNEVGKLGANPFMEKILNDLLSWKE